MGDYLRFESHDPKGPQFSILISTAIVKNIGKNSAQFHINGSDNLSIVVQDFEVVKIMADRQNQSAIQLLPSIKKRRLGRLAIILIPLGFIGAILFLVPFVLGQLSSITLDQIFSIEQEVTLRSYFKKMVSTLDENDTTVSRTEINQNERHLEEMTKLLVKSSPDLQRFRVEVNLSASNEVNAYALPGGVITINQGLISKAQSSEEIMGVLAHELGHLELRHSLRGIISASSQFAAGIGLAFFLPTDFVGILFKGYGLYQLRFSRAQEAAADKRAFELLAIHKISPDGFIQFFERLESTISFLSTHPLSSERIEMLRRQYRENYFEPIGRAPVPISEFQYNK